MMETPTTRQTLSQQRAQAAWNHTPPSVSDAYLSLVRGASADIEVSGLGQTLAFYLSKNREEHQALIQYLTEWLLEQGPTAHLRTRAPAHTAPTARLMAAIQNGSSADYRRLRTECLAYLGWLKRFAEARKADAL